MTNITKGILASLLVISCTPEEDRTGLGDRPDASALDFSVTQIEGEAYKVIVENNTPETLAYWDYRLGTSNKNKDTINLRFAGEHQVTFTAFAGGGSVSAEPVPITVPYEDPEAFADPQWEMITGGVEGKTWVLDMESPMGWAGLDYPDPDGDNWAWFPDYAGNEWVMENKNWGEMTFDLNGAPNITVTQTELEGSTQTTESAWFSFDPDNRSLRFLGDVELLYGGDYYPDVSNWQNIKVIEVSENSMRLGVLRDQDRNGEGDARIVFHYKVRK
ncbi:hypothetical protein IBL28_10450 [Sinomicrobium sp. FJxs]|uniref:PKD domain-containing protein n=1 Tax=Sinomicrobium weinanense TaxID=2842200 RepID=A0A926Q3U8_9FLAO|nr:hypothetical protein [Sinomicrobium weinanense]MBU3122608.1 hypothetical protein [Sinomicrobium weinanense]